MILPAELLLLLATSADSPHPLPRTLAEQSRRILADEVGRPSDDIEGTSPPEPSPTPTEPEGCYDCGLG